MNVCFREGVFLVPMRKFAFSIRAGMPALWLSCLITAMASASDEINLLVDRAAAREVRQPHPAGCLAARPAKYALINKGNNH